jgi:hypothetical protein
MMLYRGMPLASSGKSGPCNTDSSTPFTIVFYIIFCSHSQLSALAAGIHYEYNEGLRQTSEQSIYIYKDIERNFKYKSKDISPYVIMRCEINHFCFNERVSGKSQPSGLNSYSAHRKVSGSHLSLTDSHRHCDFRSFPQSLKANGRTMSRGRPQPLPSTSFSIHSSVCCVILIQFTFNVHFVFLTTRRYKTVLQTTNSFVK